MMKTILVWLVCFLLLTASVRAGDPPVHPTLIPVKNIILIIADGMGPEQVGLLLSYARQSKACGLRSRQTGLDRIMANGGAMGLAMTHAFGVLTTDSAAAGSQMASGRPARPGMIGLDQDGFPVRTLVEAAADAGRATGLVTNARLTHATPAAFAAHQPVRKMENKIALDMLNSGTDVMMGGGLRHWIPKEANTRGSRIRAQLAQETGLAVASKRQDSLNLLDRARGLGYDLAFDRDGLARAGEKNGKILGLFAPSGMADGIQVSSRLKDPERFEPTLAEMAGRALTVLEKDPDGFFLMIEAGQIDWAAHANDAGLMLHQLIHLDALVHGVMDWAQDRADTLVLVTADHTTGGFGFEYSGHGAPNPLSLPGQAFKNRPYHPGRNYGDPGILDRLYSQKLSLAWIFRHYDDLPASRKNARALAGLVTDNTGFPITVDQARAILAPKAGGKKQRYDARPARLARIVARDQNIVWASQNHTSTPVPVFAAGPQGTAAVFGGIYHHIDMARALFSLIGH